MEAPAQADSIAVMEVIRPLLLSPQSDQLAQDIATAIEAVCQMAKSDRKRQQALQEEVARQSAKAAAAERACAEFEARVRQLQDALESSQTDRDRLQWLERELGVQMQRADAALQRAEAAEQERAALDGRIKLLEVTTQQQNSQHDEECAALAHKWQQERARLQRKVEHWNFEVLAQQREINRLRQQVQQQQQQQQQSAAGSMRGSDIMGPTPAARYDSFTNIQPPASSCIAEQQHQQQQLRHWSGSLPDSEISLGAHARGSSVLTGQYNRHGATGSRGRSTPGSAGGYQPYTSDRQHLQPPQQQQQKQQSQQPHMQQFSQEQQHISPPVAAYRPMQYAAQPRIPAAAATEAPVAAAGRTAVPPVSPPQPPQQESEAAAEGRQRLLSERSLPVNRDSILAKHQDELQAFLSAAAGGPNVSSWIAREMGDSLSTAQPPTSRPARRPTVQTPPTPRSNDSRLSDHNYPVSSSYSSPQYVQDASAVPQRAPRQEAYKVQQQHDAGVSMGWHERAVPGDSRFQSPHERPPPSAQQHYTGTSRQHADASSSWQQQQAYHSQQQYEEGGSSFGGGRLQQPERWFPHNSSPYEHPGGLEHTYPPSMAVPPTAYHNSGSSGNHSSGYAKVPELNLGPARSGEAGPYRSAQQPGSLYTC